MIRAVLIDLSGTLHIESQPINAGAVEAITRLLRSSQFQVRFVSNTTKTSTQNLVQQLNGMGFPIQEESVYTSLTAAQQLLKQRGYKRPLLFLSEEASRGFPQDSTDELGHDSVVMGLCPEQFHYERLTQAFRLMMDRECPLFAIHRGTSLGKSISQNLTCQGRYYARQEKDLALGPGAFVAALEYATDKRAELIGKPSPAFFQTVIQELNVAPEECVMIGDDVKDDVWGAMETGIQGWLVKTGKYRTGDESYRPPHANMQQQISVFEDVVHAVNHILSS